MTPIALPSPNSNERSRLLSMDAVRRRALERLYERKMAVEDLIRSLEDYQRCREESAVVSVSFSAARKCSSSFAQSRI